MCILVDYASINAPLLLADGRGGADLPMRPCNLAPAMRYSATVGFVDCASSTYVYCTCTYYDCTYRVRAARAEPHQQQKSKPQITQITFYNHTTHFSIYNSAYQAEIDPFSAACCVICL